MLSIDEQSIQGVVESGPASPETKTSSTRQQAKDANDTDLRKAKKVSWASVVKSGLGRSRRD